MSDKRNFPLYCNENDHPELHKVFTRLRDQRGLSEFLIECAYKSLHDVLKDDRDGAIENISLMEQAKKKRDKILDVFFKEYNEFRSALKNPYTWKVGMNWAAGRSQRAGISKKAMLDEMESRYDKVKK